VDGRGLFDGLEVEGEEVFGCDEELCILLVSNQQTTEEETYETVAESHYKDCNVRWMTENTQWHQRIASDFLFAQNEQTTHDDAENDQANDFWR
jgi:hypothetical protein